MKSIRFRIARLFVGCIILAFLMSLPDQSGLFATNAGEKRYIPPPEGGSSPNSYDIGTPTLAELWVNPVTGRDSNPGTSASAPLKTLTAAWSKIPARLTTTGYRINLQPGVYPCEPAERDNCQNHFGNRAGTHTFPIILSATGGPGTTTIRGGFDMANLSYLYLIDLTLTGGGTLPTNSSGNNLLHLASVDHILLRGVTLEGPDCATDTCTSLQEVLKVNQAKYLYVENSSMGGAWHTSVDYFAVQYGHFINNDLHTAGQWCMYVKGGTSYLRVEANEFHDCQLGFSAGQSANFPVMVSPWLQYEAYDIKFVNNILHDLPGVGLSAAGGYNILFAYNTLYRVGISTDIGYPLLSVARGERGCSATDELPNPAPTCNAYIVQGGWGPNSITENVEAIPNRSVYFYNNLFYNPAPAHTQYTHFTIAEPLPRPAGFPATMPASITADSNLVIAGNVIWNGDDSMPLGIEATQACQDANPTCNAAQLRAKNAINTVAPQLANPAGGDFHPIGNWAAKVTTYAIPNFVWDIAGLPTGETSNAVPTDYEGVTRPAVDLPGAYHTIAPPIALSILRANSSPTSAASANFNVAFSEPVDGVDPGDFTLTASSGITGAAVAAVSGSGANYTVSVNTGAGGGSLRLNLVDNNSIVDAGNVPLGGRDAGDGDFSTGQAYIVRPLTQAFASAAAQDGWVLESSETGNVGSALNSAAALNLGNDAAKKQYRAILSFNTGSLPDNAVIIGVMLKVKQQAILGSGNPVADLGGFMVDVKAGPFGGAATLEPGDFQAAPGKFYGPFNTALAGGWYNINLVSAKSFINKRVTSSGLTQIRLRFRLDDNNNAVANVLSLYSGNAPAGNQPQLIIQYYAP